MTLYRNRLSTDPCGRPLYPTSVMYSRPPAKNTSTFRQRMRAKNLMIFEGSSLSIKILHRMSINTLSYAPDISMKSAPVPRPFAFRNPYWLGDNMTFFSVQPVTYHSFQNLTWHRLMGLYDSESSESFICFNIGTTFVLNQLSGIFAYSNISL
jgi:hypothetical protein